MFLTKLGGMKVERAFVRTEMNFHFVKIRRVVRAHLASPSHSYFIPTIA